MTIRLSKVNGVTFKNDDGSQRQDLIKLMKIGDELKLKREKENPFDNSAIAVFDQHDNQLGYIKKELAHDLAPNMDKGIQIRCYVKEVTGGSDTAPTFGLNIQLESGDHNIELVSGDEESSKTQAG